MFFVKKASYLGWALALFLLLTSCAPPPPSERIIGTWHSCKKHEPIAEEWGGVGLAFDDVVTFYEDGTLEWVTDFSDNHQGTYEFLSGPDSTSFDVRGEIAITVNSRKATFRYIMPDDRDLYGFILGSFRGNIMTFCEVE